MTYEEAMERSIEWMQRAESRTDGVMEQRFIALSEGWLKIAAEIRACAAFALIQAGAPLPLSPVDM